LSLLLCIFRCMCSSSNHVHPRAPWDIRPQSIWDWCFHCNAERWDATSCLCIDYYAVNKIRSKRQIPTSTGWRNSRRNGRISALPQDWFIAMLSLNSCTYLTCSSNCFQCNVLIVPIQSYAVSFKQRAKYVSTYQCIYTFDILIHLQIRRKHAKHLVRQLLRRQRRYVKRTKRIFEAQEIEFCGFTGNADGILLQTEMLEVIAKWPTQESVTTSKPS